MPNWVRNEMRFKKEFADKIIKLPEGETDYLNGEVDFNQAVPMPESLNVTSGGSNDEDIYVYLSDKLKISINDVKKMPNSSLIGKYFFGSNERFSSLVAMALDTSFEGKQKLDKKYEAGKVLVENYEKYGAITWYEWCYANWGTKWNAGESQITEDGDFYEVYFDTAWAPPVDWLKTLHNKGIEFDLEWHEEQGYHGEIISKDGMYEENDLEFESYDEDEEEEYE